MNLQDYLSGKDNVAPGEARDWLPFCILDIATGALWARDPHIADALDGAVVQVPCGRHVVEGQGTACGRNRFVSRLRVRLEGANNPTLGVELGKTGTDSGMIGICDIKAFDNACGPNSDNEVQEAIESQTSVGFGIITLERFPGAVMPFVPTGSDGSGPILALMSNGTCVGIELRFFDRDDAV